MKNQYFKTTKKTENMMRIRSEARYAFMTWWNDYLLVERFAEDHGLSLKKANQLIRVGRTLHDQYAEYLKTI